MFSKVVIVGVGLLGGSLARDLRQQKLAARIVGVCRSEETKRRALELQVVDEVADLPAAIKDAELIVMATPMQVMVPLLEQIRNDINPATIITDVGSVKTDLYAALQQRCPQLLDRFVLAHPIAGGEDSGVGASKTGLFDNKHVILTKTAEAKAEYSQRVERLWRALGAQVLAMSLQQHDAIFARTSHLPHVVAYTLVNYLNGEEDRDQLFELAAAGFYDFSRIASSNAEMWRDICITNRTEILRALDGFHSQISQIRDKIASADQQAILQQFSAAKAARDAGLANKASRQKMQTDSVDGTRTT